MFETSPPFALPPPAFVPLSNLPLSELPQPVLPLIGFTVTLATASLLAVLHRLWRRHGPKLLQRLDDTLNEHCLPMRPSTVIGVYLALLVGIPAGLLLSFDAPAAAAVLIGFTLVLPALLGSWLAKRRQRGIDEALPDALAQWAGAMQAGSTLMMAMQRYVDDGDGPLVHECRIMLSEYRLGSSLMQALDDLGARVGSEEMDLVVAAVGVTHSTGGHLGEVLQRLSLLMRQRLEMEGRVRALTSQGVMQGRVVSALPYLLLGGLWFVEPAATRALIDGLLGWLVLGLILLLQTCGAMMIRRIVRIRL